MTGLDEVPHGAADLIRDLGKFIGTRIHRQAAGDVGELAFLRDGILKSLQKIAGGQGAPADRERLQQQLAATELGVNEIIERLSSTRDQLTGQAGSSEFVNRIDDVVDGSFGESSIGDRIGEVIAADLRSPELPALAQAVCKEINAFNRAVIDLARRAKNWSNEADPLAVREFVEPYQKYGLEDLYTIVGNHAEKFLTGADRQRYVLEVPDACERGRQIVGAYRRKICETQTRFDLEVAAELSGGSVLEPIAWLHTITRFKFEFRILDGLKIDAGDAVAMALGHLCDWDLYKLCDEQAGQGKGDSR
jgi:hypothetical protein